MQDGRVQVVDVDFLLDRGEAELVGRSVCQAALDAAAGQPDAEAVVVVVAAVAPLARGRAAEFAAPEDQRVIEQTELLQVAQ